MRLKLREFLLLSLWIPALAHITGTLFRYWGVMR
jgi:hypothetical protein